MNTSATQTETLFCKLANLSRGAAKMTVASLLTLTIARGAVAQTAPKYVVTVGTTLATPSGFGGPNGNLATDKFGNLFVPDAAQSQVLEFPVNGSAPIVIFDATKTGPQVSGVTVDANNNLYVTTRYDSNITATETDIFEFPYSSSGYPGPFAYTGASQPSCSATSTSVCNYGNFLQETGGYYQPQAIGFDAAGNGYMITTYDSLTGGGLTIFACSVQCGYDNASATIAVNGLPTKATSLAVASNGDLYWADGTDVYYAKAGTGVPLVFDKSYESPYGGAAGVGFDHAGNLLVTNSAGTFEIPSINGVITAGNKFQVAVSTVGGYTGAAVDNSGNVYSAAYGTVLESSLYNYNFGAIATGSTTASQTFTITFLSAGSIASLVAEQSGAGATEFPFSQGTCVAAAYAAASTCTFTVSFAPTAVGTRRGTIVMTDASGLQTYVFVVGVGQGTGVAVDPGTPTAVTTSLKAPSGLAVDANGNVFAADASAKAVYEYVGGAGNPVSIGSGYTKPTGVATDGAGNLYVVDQGAGTVSMFANNAGSFLTSSTGKVLVSGLTSPTDIVVSGTGAMYVSNTGANLVEQYPNASRLGSLSSVVSLGANLSGPTGLALDPTGNLYIADTANNRVVQLTSSGAQAAVGSGLNLPTGVAAEASGSVLIADQGNGRVVRIPNEAGTLTTADQVVLSQPLVDPFSIRLSSSGNLYVSDNAVGAIDLLQRTAGTLNFGFSNVNTPTPAQTIVVSSTGTADLTLVNPFFTAPPAGSNFTLVTGSGTTGCSSGSLTSGRDCTLNSVFTPTSTGTKNYTASLNAPAFNAAAPSIALIGQGVNLVATNVTLSQTSPAGTVTYGVPVVLTVAVASASASSTAVPAGTVTFNVDGNNTKPVALSATGTASYTLTGLAGQSSHSVIATYNGGSIYAPGSSTPYSFVVQPASTNAILTIYAKDSSLPAPVSSIVGDSVSFSVVIAPSVVVSAGLNGTVNFVSGSTVLGSSTISQNSSTGVYSAGISTTTLPASCSAGQTLPGCSGILQVQAVFAGNGNYSGFATAPQTVIITSAATFTVIPSNTTITATAAQYGTSTLTVTSYSGFQSGVSLSCTGLPANAYCIFRPGLVSLTSITNGTGTSATTSIPVQTTTMEVRVDQNPTNIQSASGFGLLGGIVALAIFLTGSRRRSFRALTSCCALVLVGTMGLIGLDGCGGSSKAYVTPNGTFPLTLQIVATPVPGGQTPTTANIASISTCAAAQSTIVGLACTQSGSYVAITTGSTGGFAAGAMMTIAGASPSTFNGNYTVLGDTYEPIITAGVTLGSYDVVEFMPSAGAATSGTGGTIRLANVTTSLPFTLIVK